MTGDGSWVQIPLLAWQTISRCTNLCTADGMEVKVSEHLLGIGLGLAHEKNLVVDGMGAWQQVKI